MFSFGTVKNFAVRIKSNWYMIKTMAIRNLKAKYIGSFGGLLWSILNPLFLIVIYGILFGLFLKFKPGAEYRTESYFLFLVTGMIPWTFFSTCIIESTSSILGNANLIKKTVGFPSEILPIVTVLTNLIDHLIAMAVVLVILFFNGIVFTPYLFFLFPYLIVLSIFILGIAWFFSSLNVYIRDVQPFINLLMMAWMFFTPLFYSLDLLPKNFLPLLKLNPMVHFIQGYRASLLGVNPILNSNLIYFLIFALITFAIGGHFFSKLKKGFAEVL